MLQGYPNGLSGGWNYIQEPVFYMKLETREQRDHNQKVIISGGLKRCALPWD